MELFPNSTLSKYKIKLPQLLDVNMTKWENLKFSSYPAGIYLLKINNKNIRTRYKRCSKLTIKTPERRNWRHSGLFIANFEHILHHVIVFLSFTLKM